MIVRELLPQDLKIVAEQFSKAEGVRVARSLAAVWGRAHGRQMSADDRRAWRAAVEADGWEERAPHWLWSSVTTLMGQHQSGYLAHCREVARDKASARCPEGGRRRPRLTPRAVSRMEPAVDGAPMRGPAAFLHARTRGPAPAALSSWGP